MTDATYIKIIKLIIRPTPKDVGFGGTDSLFMDDSASSHEDLCVSQYLAQCDRTHSRIIGGGTGMLIPTVLNNHRVSCNTYITFLRYVFIISYINVKIYSIFCSPLIM